MGEVEHDEPVTVWWSPGEPEDDLHGFVTLEHLDACDAGEPGPFLRIVRNHHKLGPVPPEIMAMRRLFEKWARDARSAPPQRGNGE